MDVIAAFTQAMHEHGIETETFIQADGQRHRFRVTGDKAGSENGWYVLHLGGVPAGAFGCWKRDISERWCAKSTNTMTDIERQALTARIEATKREQEAETARVRAECKAKAELLWPTLAMATSDNPYLARKGVGAYGVRQDERGALVVPVTADGTGLVGFQFIWPDGTKRPLTGTPMKGSHHRIDGSMERVLICEGYATGASLHEATGFTVVIAFAAGNLLTVSQALRAKLPDAVLVLCAEDDRNKTINTGMIMATAAARAAGGLLAIPTFAANSDGTDFNDMHQQQGIDAVRATVEATAFPCVQHEAAAPDHIADANSMASDAAGGVATDAEKLSLRDAEGRRKSQATLMIELASGLELFKDHQEKGYAIVPVGVAKQVLPIRSKAFHAHLEHELYKLTKKGAGGQAKQDAVDTLDAKARFEGTTRDVFIRVAATSDAVYLDLCDEQWRVVEIRASGWQVLDESPVMFVRRQDMKALPVPLSGGGTEQLRQFVNVTDQDWPLIYGWLLAALRGATPFPVMILQGEQGSGKSTTARALRELVDPSGSPLQAPPRKAEDMTAIAANCYVVALDNLSGMDAEMSDGICRLSTGAGISKRQLYTDNDLVTVALARPVMVNGIDQLGSRADLMSRAVQPELPLLLDANKHGEAELWRKYYAERPAILGALLDMLAAGLKGFDEQLPPKVGRLRDWARLVSAAERVSGKPCIFADAYGENVHAGAAQTVEASPFASAVQRLVMRDRTWQGTASDLLRDARAMTDEHEQKSKDFPSTNRVVANALTRAAPALRAMGVVISYGHGKQRVISLGQQEQACKTSSLSSASSKHLPLLGSSESNIVVTSSNQRSNIVANDDRAILATINDGASDDVATITERLKTSGGASFDDADDNDDKFTPYSDSSQAWDEGVV